MQDRTNVHSDPAAIDAEVRAAAPAESAELRVTALASLLENLDEAIGKTPEARSDAVHQTELAKRRLGIASSLFIALRAKHPPTAAHCLRVALACSCWADAGGLPDLLRDELEIAALLHDVGKIGIPDEVLLKPGRLVGEELLVMDRHRLNTLDILSACESEGVLDVLRYAGAWYDGRREGYERKGDEIPLGARILSITDAFDSMTTDHVYRPAMSRERALAELFEHAGTQFDPNLVKDFSTFVNNHGIRWDTAAARRWLRDIQPNDTPRVIRAESRRVPSHAGDDLGVETQFHERLLESMHDGVFFVDASLRVVLWNRAAERLTGITQSSVVHTRFLPSVLQMRQENGDPIEDDACPVAKTIGTGVQTLKRMTIVGRKGRRMPVNVHVVPVLGPVGERKGAAILLHDASSQITLEERVQRLHERATQDPLTKVANRAEFDRVLAEFVETHLREAAPCSLIICDIDHFKKINDVHGHQAGDEALVSFASALRSFCRAGDLVARYGGEEFVMLCADCDNATATKRAEDVRRTVAACPQPSLGGRSITASFGVTEIQPGDTPETMLRRSDRALLQAKDTGRNRVVQLGSGMHEEELTKRTTLSWLSNLFNRSGAPDVFIQHSLITSVPLKIAAEKLKGFVSDHHAEILEIQGNQVRLKIDGTFTPLTRRHSDRAVPFFIELDFQERRAVGEMRTGGSALRTLINVGIRPARKRDRRRRDMEQRANQLLSSLKSYFMAHSYSLSSGKPADTEVRPEESATENVIDLMLDR
jgi:diguanylate cyclase (GGDEF)-like protein/PAS domain S-box-containing protein